MIAVSVVIPLFNKAATIERTLTSVLRQTVPAAEIIVVDDGSSDDGANRVRGLKNVRLVQQPNEGVASARNKGIDLATSPWVAFVDADDTWDPEHLETMARAHAYYPDAVMYGCAYRKVDAAGRMIKLRHPDPPSGTDCFLLDDYFSVATRYEQPICSSSVVVRRDVLLRMDGFPRGIRAGEDLLTWARLACEGDVVFSVQSTATFHCPDIRFTDRASRIRNEMRSPPVPDRVGEALGELACRFPERAPSIRAYLGLWHRMRAMTFCELDNRIGCLQELARARRISGAKPRDAANALLLLLPVRIRAALLTRIRLLRQSSVRA